ncbi:TVP38/TMEM64 family protein [uncultured Kriegella sp.]|uniref:TVP38/TMEM64 family protein n=1 Tax=uncultured Kriegella sp. TaxID=1798910 RepID=UPI0030DA130D|tara:strand:+ start:72475 stop:73176 length:702 start_codon:yes stop_codon:yes gene_type:complete
MSEMREHNKPAKKSKTPLFLSIALLVTVIICYYSVPAVHDFLSSAWNVLTSDDEDKIRTWVSGFGWLGPIVLILAMVLQMFLIVVPTIVLMVVSILAYGPIWGSIVIFASVFAASSVGYAIGSYLGKDTVERLIGHKSEKKVSDFLDDYGFWAVIITRINPFLSNDAISFVGGILRMGYWKFIGATLVGITPLVIFIAILGKNTDSLKTGLLWGSGISLLLFGIYIWWDKRKK